ncbi:ORC-CDC6 family AAA ATPase [Corallococcus aberystwythensis]|uniref:ORC-CDC6 family AAA ATPase n=1 Tax=Corallococcus aberystwythensis TaxID=2316722 RepID=UPI001ABF800A|nr:hypothetical protein [Corallococcus aberystwythensis]
MDTIDRAPLRAANPEKILTELFGEFRSEWRQDLFGTLFIEPNYFKKLEAPRPTLLVGGRGTGKTTALKSLRFDATRVRMPHQHSAPERLPYLGIYIKINKNQSHAFNGEATDPRRWSKLFSHYFNLLVCQEFCRLYAWLIKNEGWSTLRQSTIRDLSKSLALATADDLAGLSDAVRTGIIALEFHVNNINTQGSIDLSIAESPVRLFAETIQEQDPIQNRTIFCAVDEYENLLDYQQAVVNTYIKHSAPPLSYKIGVRRNGLRCRQTIDSSDMLGSPHDLLEVDISNEENFETFAMHVAEKRILHAREVGAPVHTLDDLLPDLSRREEAHRLGALSHAEEVLTEVSEACRPEVTNWIKSIPPEDLYFLQYWSESSHEPVPSLANDWFKSPDKWSERLNNHGYASLFWITKGHRGVRVRKYYCGTRTFLGISSGNIRYFLELIHESLSLAFASTEESAAKALKIDPKIQTAACKTVGKRRLDQLEGLSEHGREIKRMVLAIGKVFFELARNPEGHSPEINSFVLAGSNSAKVNIIKLLEDGVGHLAFEATPRTKATSTLETKEDEYRLHPIFSPFFEFSHRRKRRITFSAEALERLKDAPRQAISQLLQDRSQTPQEDLPEQLALFSAFFSGGQAT